MSNTLGAEMRAVLSLLLVAVSGCSFNGPAIQGSGNVKSEPRVVDGVREIEVVGMGHLFVEQGDADTLTVTADDNILPLLETKAENGVLRLAIARNQNIRPTKLEYRVTAKDPRRFAISGAGKVDASKLNTEELTASISGSGDVKLSGEAAKLELQISGAGHCSAENLNAKSAKVGISGAGDVTVNASEKLEARVSGAGTVVYLGSPALTTTISGAGSVRKK
jgi:hypothetical protein